VVVINLVLSVKVKMEVLVVEELVVMVVTLVLQQVE
jgi:hypothetical protein